MPVDVMDGDWGKLDEIGAELDAVPPSAPAEAPTPDDPQPSPQDDGADEAAGDPLADPREPEGAQLDEKGVTLPDGTVIPLKKILQWQENEAKRGEGDTENGDQGADDGKDPFASQIKALEEKIEELKRPVETPEPQPLDPFEKQGEWLAARREEYLAAGWPPDKVTTAMLHNDLALAQNLKLREVQGAKDKQIEELNAKLESLQRERDVQQQLSKLQEKYPNLQGELGEEILGLYLAKNQGEKDLEKVAKAAHNHINRVVSLWAARKRDAVKNVVRGMPRGGGSRMPPQPELGNDLASLDRLGEMLR